VQELNPLVKVAYITKPLNELMEEDLRSFTMVCVGDASFEEQIQMNKLCRSLNIGFFAASSFGWTAFMFEDLGPQFSYVIEKASDKTNAEGERETEQIPRETSFETFEDAMNIPLGDVAKTIRSRKRPLSIRDSRLSVMETLTTLHMLRAQKSRNSDVDVRALLKEILEKNSVSQDSLVDSETVLSMFSDAVHRTELSPVCAVAGGIVGQEILKAISKKRSPLNNAFFFDGITGGGLVKKLGGK